MFRNEDEFKKLIGRLNIDNEPDPAHRENLRRQILSAFNRTQQKTLHADHWQTLGRIILKSKIMKFATAAVIIVAICFFFTRQSQHGKIETQRIVQTASSPAELTTLASLSFAYRQGGMERVEQICDKALAMAGPQPNGISVQDLLGEFNGKIQKGQSYEK